MTQKDTSADADRDEALATEARGEGPTSDDAEEVADEGVGEIDAIGEAAGVHNPRDKPLNATDELAKRDEHRWELDPASAEDAEGRMP